MSFSSNFNCALLTCSIALAPLPLQAAKVSDLQAQFASGAQAAKILSDLNEYLEQSPEDYPALFLKARLLEQTGQTAGSEEIYRQLIQQDPIRPEAYNNLARIRVANNDLAGAQSLLEQALKAHPGYATVYDNLSQIYVAMAKESYGKALRIDTAEDRIVLAELSKVSDQATNKSNDADIAKDVQLSLSNEKTKSVTPIKSQAAFDKGEIITTLEGWAAAWSEQAADVYFIFYADDYHPPGKSRRHWEKERRIRLKKPNWIKIGLKDIDVKPLNKIEAQVEFIQDYRASNYQDMSKKELRLRQTPDGWRITAERSLAKVN